MSKENQVSIQISPADLKTVLEAAKLIETVLKPYLIALTPDERKKKAKMGDKTVTFVEKTTEYAVTNPEFAPSFLNVEDLLIDFKAVGDLTQIIRPLEQLVSKLGDTILLSGSEALMGGLMYYSSVKQANKSNIPNAKTIFEDLKVRYEISRSKKV